MVVDISAINFFMPVFSFLLVFLIVYSVLKKTEILGDSDFINTLVSFIIPIIFLSFSSLELYVKTIVPWFAVLLVCVFLIMALTGLSNKDIGSVLGAGFSKVVIGILIIAFLIAAIKVFNPIFHPDLIITSGEGTSLIEQIRYSSEGKVFGTLMLIIVSSAVAWVITKK